MSADPIALFAESVERVALSPRSCSRWGSVAAVLDRPAGPNLCACDMCEAEHHDRASLMKRGGRGDRR